MPEQALSAENRPVEKPFPWRCPKCRQPTVTRVTVPYRGQRTQEGRVVTVEIPNLAVPRCSNCGEVVFDYSADEQIRAAFRNQFGPRAPAIELTSLEIDANRNRMIAKHLLAVFAVLCFATGLFFLFHGESVLALYFVTLILVILQTREIVGLGMRVERLENYLMALSYSCEDSEHTGEDVGTNVAEKSARS
ncbi:MAG TPA: hypothetical protein VMG10_00625 [Gemmataceae bacterium]|nr:hypothetical protein [Gemmataceae bacterium]